ncbi:MAG: DUF1574 domain-containing protein [Candidatus Omnitrophica bacterium]|nr:DUF1574 domain-containing protein [Candidatus Omnitrophota bacterium]
MNLIHIKRLMMDQAAAANMDMIILGDSRVLGVDARYMSDRLSRDFGRHFLVYNFAMPNQGVRSYQIFLQKYLKKGNPPKYVMFSSAPFAITGLYALEKHKDSRDLLYRMMHMYNMREVIGKLPWKVSLRLLGLKIEGLIHIVHYRKAIREGIRGAGNFQHDYFDEMARYVWATNGAYQLNNFSRIPREMILQSGYYNIPLNLDADMDKEYRKFFELSRRHGIIVFLITAPINEIIYDKREKLNENDYYRGVLAQWAAEYPNIRIVEPSLRSYPAEDFTDTQHMNPRGVGRFVKDLTNEVAAQIGGGSI